MTLKLKDICVIDWGNTSLTKKAYEVDGEYLAVSATGADGKISHYEHEADVCVLSAIGAQCGKMFFPQQRFTAIKNTITLTPNRELVDSKYLYYLFTHIELPKRGAAQPFISKGDIEKFELPHLPPLAEQQRIVTKLDAAFSEIDRGIKTTKAKESEISRLNTSILSTTLSEHNHKRVKLGSIATVIAGQSPKSEYYNKEGRGTPFYQGKKDYGKRYLNEPTVWTDKVTKLAEKNDILLSVRAPVGALNIATQQICIGRGLAAIRPSTKILNDYLFYSLFLISNKLEGSSGAIFNSINKSQIEALEVPLPPIKEQQNIVDKLDAALEKIKLTEYSNEAIIKNFIKLKLALLVQELQSEAA